MAKRPVKIAFYSPYLPDHLGGGEKHLLDIAAACARHGYEVSLCLPISISDTEIVQLQSRLRSVFGINPESFQWFRSPLFSPAFSWKKIRWTKQFDVLYFVTDGSLFYSQAKQNILHIQIPFTTPLRGIFSRWKLRNWRTIQTNSEFTKQIIESSWSCTVDQVLYPVVDSQLFELAGRKEKIILSVGRFYRQLHSKRQDVLVRAFQLLKQRTAEAADWQLVLLGSVEDEAYFSEIRQLASGLPIRFITNASRNDVLNWFQKATLYWHAAGFEQDEKKSPEKVEHFGISTVEAMAAGVVPLAVGKGGPKEILTGELADLQWQTVEELITKTSILLRSPEYLRKFRVLAVERAHDFDTAHFELALAKLFKWKEPS